MLGASPTGPHLVLAVGSAAAWGPHPLSASRAGPHWVLPLGFAVFMSKALRMLKLDTLDMRVFSVLQVALHFPRAGPHWLSPLDFAGVVSKALGMLELEALVMRVLGVLQVALIHHFPLRRQAGASRI